jgi:sugar O-acyltransferase (sialic acid O-acetyltransferase NeuD family)
MGVLPVQKRDCAMPNLAKAADATAAAHSNHKPKKEVIIFGAGDIAEVASFYFAKDAERKTVAFAVDGQYMKEPVLNGIPVVAFEDLANAFPASDYEMFVGLSYSNLNRDRAAKCAEALQKGYSLTNFVHSRSPLACEPRLGVNCFILEDVTIQPFVEIGNNVTIWSGTHVGHHVRIGDNCFITSHAVLSGGVSLGNNCFLGVNATLRDHISVGSFSVIGAGALLLESAKEESVYPGAATKAASFPSSKLRKL